LKKLLLFLFSILISFNSYGEWIEVTTATEIGNIYYIDKETIKSNNGYVYWYQLNNFKKRDKFGDMSAVIYVEGDCEINRSRMLSGIFFNQPMGTIENARETAKNPKWTYTFPGQINAQLLNYACSVVN